MTASPTTELKAVELRVDVTDDAGIGGPAHTAVTVHFPDPSLMTEPPVVCFAFPGGGYSRGYYSMELPDGRDRGQASWHAEQGWIFVSCDHLGFGDSTAPDGDVLNYDNVAAGNRATVVEVLRRLECGDLADGFPPVHDPVTLALGQSMGGCFTIVLQGQHRVFDGVALLGFSAIHTVVPGRPGGPDIAWPWMLRTRGLAAAPLNAAAFAAPQPPADAAGARAPEHPFTWAFHWDDEPPELVAIDMASNDPDFADPLPPWRSPTTPSCGIYMVAPGTVATEAAAIDVPVLVATGERDVVPNPWLEPLAYRSATDITVYVCPRMAHMHNFAGTRHRFWARIQAWGESVAAARRDAQDVA